MSISNAMQAGVSGMSANAQSINRISENIANLGTDGYRRTFSQMVTSTTSSPTMGLAPSGVRAVDGVDMMRDGSVRITNRPTDLALTGPGFFAVSKTVNETVESNYALTRAGSFEADADGNLRNAAGYYLAGFPYGNDGTVGVVDRGIFGDLETVNIADVTMAGSATLQASVSGNLPSQTTGLATPGDPFTSTVTYYTALGNAERMQVAWQPSAVPNNWTLSLSDSTGAAIGQVDVAFSDTGATAGSPDTYSNIVDATGTGGFAFDPLLGEATLNMNGQTFMVEFGVPGEFNGITQFAGDYRPLTVDADGTQTGNLVRVEIDDRGDLFGIFDNGERKALYNIPVASVTNADGMSSQDGNVYSITRNSGALYLAQSGDPGIGIMSSGALEGSNVEVAEELTQLIQTQRAYSSSAKIVTTADEMLDETLRLKR